MWLPPAWWPALVNFDSEKREEITPHTYLSDIVSSCRSTVMMKHSYVHHRSCAANPPDSVERGPSFRNARIPLMDSFDPFIFQLPPTKNFLSRVAISFLWETPRLYTQHTSSEHACRTLKQVYDLQPLTLRITCTRWVGLARLTFACCGLIREIGWFQHMICRTATLVNKVSHRRSVQKQELSHTGCKSVWTGCGVFLPCF